MRLESLQGQEIFPFSKTSKPFLQPTQSPIPWTPGTLFWTVQQPLHEANHSPPSSVEVKNKWDYTSTPLICLHSAHRDKFTFLLFYLSAKDKHNLQTTVSFLMTKHSNTLLVWKQRLLSNLMYIGSLR